MPPKKDFGAKKRRAKVRKIKAVRYAVKVMADKEVEDLDRVNLLIHGQPVSPKGKVNH